MSIADKIDVEKIVENLQNFKTKLLKSELFKIGFVVFFGLILLLFVLPFFLDNSGLKFQIEQKINQTYGANFTINGDVKVALFPSPKVIASDVLLYNYQPKDADHKESEKAYNFYAKKVEIKLPVFQFISGGLIKEIIFTDAVIAEHYSRNKAARVDKFSEAAAKFIKNDATQPVKNEGGGISATLLSIDNIDMSQISSSNLPDFIIKNGAAIFYDKSSSKKEFSAINVIAQVGEEKIMANGSFIGDGVNSNFKLLAKFNVKSPTYKSSFELSSSALDLKINGNFTSENKGLILSDFKGNIEGEILDLKSFYKSYISDNSVIFNKIRAGAKAIKISADINNSAGEIRLKDLVMSSALINGKGDIEVDLSTKIPMIDLSFDLDDLDLDEIWSSEAVKVSEAAMEEDIQKQAGLVIKEDAIDEKDETKDDVATTDSDKKDKDVSVIIAQDLDSKEDKPKEENNKINDIENNLNFINKIKNFDLTSEIKIKNVKYADGEIKDVDLYLTVSSEGQILVLPLIFKTPGDGLFRVNGAFDNDGNSAKFVGKFDASGKALQEILKWMRIESQNLKFENLREYSVYSDVLLLPNSVSLNNLYLNLNSGQNEFLGEVKIINNEKIVNISNKFRISDFNMDDYFLTSGSNIYLSPGSLIKKLFWLNNISANNDLELNFDKLTYKGEEFSNQSIKARFGRGYFAINKLHLLSETTDLNIDLNVDISDKSPRFDLKIIANNFDYETIQNNEKPDDVNKVGKRNFIDQFYALPSLEGLDGKIFFSFENLTLDDIDLENVKLIGKLKDGGVDISELTFDIYDGTIGYKGLLGIKVSKIINGNLSLSDVSLQPLLSDLFGINNVSGVVNVSSSLTAAADQKEDFAKALTGEVKFSANAPTIAGYGLNDLVKKMFSPQVYASELVDSEKILFNPESNAIFKDASGVFQINGSKESKLRITTSATALNGVLSGKIDLANNKIDALFNVIFLTGNLKKPTPINIATNLKGDLSAISQSSNLSQVRQYLGLEKTTLIVPQATQDQTSILPSVKPPVSGDNNLAPKENNSRQDIEMMDLPQNETQNKP